VYFGSGADSKEKETEKESKRLETASERAPSPPPMFDRSERFNDRFSDIYCDRRTGGRFSDKFSDRCSDRYSDRFSDTESLHNEVRTKLTTLQKAVRQKKRLSISTMSSSEFELESVASESSYAEYVDRLRVKPAALPDVQHSGLRETQREFQGKKSGREPSQSRTRHSFEPQSRTRAIQIMRGDLVDTKVPQGGRTRLDTRYSETVVEKQAVSEHDRVVSEHEANTELSSTDTRYSENRKSAQEESKSATSVREKFLSEGVTSGVAAEAEELYEEEEGSVSLRAHYEKSLEAERKECEEKLLALRIRKWQQGSRMSEEETFPPDSDLPTSAEYMEPTGLIYTQQEVVEAEAPPTSFQKPPTTQTGSLVTEAAGSKSPQIKAREVDKSSSIVTESASVEVRSEEVPPKSPKRTGRSAEAEAKSEERRRPRPVRSAKERFLSDAEAADSRTDETIQAQYEKSLEAERMECEEKLLALRTRKWQQGVPMSEEESFHPETDLPMPADTQYTEPEELIYTQKEVEEKRAAGEQAAIPKSPKVQGRAEQEKTSRIEARTGELETEASAVLVQKSPRTKSRVTTVESSPKTKARAEKMLFEKTREERELQLSMENLSELKTESEKLVSEEEALTQRIMRWQQDVLMEQEQAVQLESDWVESYPQLQEEVTPEAGGAVTEASALESIPPPATAVSSRKISPEKPAKEKFLLSGSAPPGFQDQEDESLQGPMEGRETRLQRDSEYFVSEEEALAQRILKWQQDVVEPEEVAELESEWTELHRGSSPPCAAAAGGGSPAKKTPHQAAGDVRDTFDLQASPPCGDLGGATERRPSKEEFAMTGNKSRNQRFQEDVREKRGAKEEIGRAREGLAGMKRDGLIRLDELLLWVFYQI